MSDDNDFETRIAAARILYEGTHGMSLGQLAEVSGIPKRTLQIYSRDQSWTKLLETKHGGSTPEAQEAAAMFAGQAVEQAKVAADTQGVLDENSKALTDPLPAEREALLARHKEEWKVPRALSAQAMKLAATNPMQAFERAKLAKITSENLTLVQNGERKAYGIDKGVGDHTVVVERT